MNPLWQMQNQYLQVCLGVKLNEKLCWAQPHRSDIEKREFGYWSIRGIIVPLSGTRAPTRPPPKPSFNVRSKKARCRNTSHLQTLHDLITTKFLWNLFYGIHQNLLHSLKSHTFFCIVIQIHQWFQYNYCIIVCFMLSGSSF